MTVLFIPRLEGWEEHGGGYPAEYSSDKEPREVRRQFGEAAKSVDDGEGYCHLPINNYDGKFSINSKEVQKSGVAKVVRRELRMVCEENAKGDAKVK